MSVLYDKYKKLKDVNDSKCYLFENGVFYTMIDDDANRLAPILNLKLVHLNETIMKCGFPRNSFDKYKRILNDNNIDFDIVGKSPKISSDEVIELIKGIDINNITPLQALSMLKEVQEKI